MVLRKSKELRDKKETSVQDYVEITLHLLWDFFGEYTTDFNNFEESIKKYNKGKKHNSIDMKWFSKYKKHINKDYIKKRKIEKSQEMMRYFTN